MTASNSIAAARAPRRPRTLASLGAAAVLGLVATAYGPQDGPAGERGRTARDVDGARAALEQRAETLRLISKERADWATGRTILEDRIDLVSREIAELRANIETAEASITDTQEKVAELESEEERLVAAVGSLDGAIDGVEARVLDMLERLPAPVVERVKPNTQAIPADPAATKLSLSDRFLNVVAIVNEADKFNREVTARSEIRELPDGSGISVTALYVGVGQGYCVSDDATSAWIGTSTPDGWEWIAYHDRAPEIAELVAIHGDEIPAAFVEVPVSID